MHGFVPKSLVAAAFVSIAASEVPDPYPMQSARLLSLPLKEQVILNVVHQAIWCELLAFRAGSL
jgi:hypothetical protein